MDDDSDFNLAYDIEEEIQPSEDDPEFNIAYDVMLALPNNNRADKTLYFFQTKATNPNGPTNKGCSTRFLDSIGIKRFKNTVKCTHIVKKYLADPRINVNKCKPYRGQTEIGLGCPSVYPFLLSIYKGNIEIIKALLAAPGLNLDISDEYGITPLGVALTCQNDNYPRDKIVNLLMNTEGISKTFTFLVEKSRFCRRPPEIAGGVVDIETKSYVDGKEVHYIRGAELFQSVQQQNIQNIVTLLQEPMIDINCIVTDRIGLGTFPLAEAVRTDNIEIVKLLLAHPRIDVNNKLACETDWNYFHDLQFNVPTGETALYTAVEQGNLRMVSLLLTHPDINVNQANVKVKHTPLMRACMHNNIDIVRCLLSAPTININQKDYRGRSALTLTGCYDLEHITEHIKTVEDIQTILLSHPTMERSASRQFLSSKWLQQGPNATMIKVINPNFIKCILQLETDNPRKLKTALHKALLFAMEHSPQHIAPLMDARFKIYRLLRMAIQSHKNIAVKFLIKTMSIKSLKKTLDWIYTKKYAGKEKFNFTAAEILEKRIQLLVEFRSITEIELFSTHLRVLPVDVQKIIAKMLLRD